MVPSFLEQPLILPTPPFLWENSELPIFEKISKTETPHPSLYKEGGGGDVWGQQGGFELCTKQKENVNLKLVHLVLLI